MVIFGDDRMAVFFLQKKHWHQWFFDGSWVTQPSPLNDFQPPDHWFQWFFDGFGVFQLLVSMVMDHWSNDAMVPMYPSPLFYTKKID